MIDLKIPRHTAGIRRHTPRNIIYTTFFFFVFIVMMSSVHNSVETVNAAATAIFTAETRVQPSAVQKRRWGSFWSLRYWCFGSSKHNTKRIGHAVLVSSEPNPPGLVSPMTSNHGNNNINNSSTVVMPFIAPPSSPASFLPSDSPSGTRSPADNFLSLGSSLSVHSKENTRQIYTIGPYAHETQLVSPPVFSAFATEPSTASFTPPPEPVQMTTPSSPEVPFAQLLSSSLARKQRYGGNNLGQSLSQYGFKSSSGTSSPFLDKQYPCYEYYPNNKWGSRVGSGSLTPNGAVSRFGSGSLTPNGGISRLDSGSLTPNHGIDFSSREGKYTENEVSKVASLANSDGDDSRENDTIIDHRVSFRLFDEDIPVCTVREALSTHKISSPRTEDGIEQKDLSATDEDGSFTVNSGNISNKHNYNHKNHTVSLGSSKDFHFNNAKEEVLHDEDEVDKEMSGPRNSWSFFPMLQSGIR